MKPIEPGCLALCLSDQWSGIVSVRENCHSEWGELLVGRKCEGCRAAAEFHYWLTDGLPNAIAAAECILHRIDGGDFADEEDAEQLVEVLGIDHRNGDPHDNSPDNLRVIRIQKSEYSSSDSGATDSFPKEPGVKPNSF